MELGGIIKERLGYVYLEYIMDGASEHIQKELMKEYVEKF